MHKEWVQKEWVQVDPADAIAWLNDGGDVIIQYETWESFWVGSDCRGGHIQKFSFESHSGNVYGSRRVSDRYKAIEAAKRNAPGVVAFIGA